jgi:hypothetical protein
VDFSECGNFIKSGAPGVSLAGFFVNKKLVSLQNLCNCTFSLINELIVAFGTLHYFLT